MVQVCVMQTLGDLFRRAREARGWSQDALARKSGVPKNTIQNVETGRSTKPNGSTILRMLKAFDFLTTDELRRSLGERADPPFRAAGGTRIINKVKAGHAMNYEDVGEDNSEYLQVPPEVFGDMNAFALEVVGDSMEPHYREGNRIICSPSAELSDGDPAIVQFNGDRFGENTFKRVFDAGDDVVRLVADNPKYKPQIILKSEIARIVKVTHIIGVAV